MPNRPLLLETVSVTIPDDALEAFEAALSLACDTVGFFRDDAAATWRVEGVKPVGVNDTELAAALALAAAVSGVAPPLQRVSVEAEGWLERTYSAFPEQKLGRRFAICPTHLRGIRPTHLHGPAEPNRITLVLDASVAFGSGEHGSTRGCMLALEAVARRRPRRILDLGTGSGILAMAAAKLLHRPVLATDIEAWSIRVARQNARLNGVGRSMRVRLADGWGDPVVRAAGPYDLIFANILARPLALMARDLALHLAPSGAAILAGLLHSQMRWVVSAHRRHGLRLERLLRQGNWTTVVLRKPAAPPE